MVAELLASNCGHSALPGLRSCNKDSYYVVLLSINLSFIYRKVPIF